MTVPTEDWEGTSVTPLQLMTRHQENMVLASMSFHVSTRWFDKYVLPSLQTFRHPNATSLGEKSRGLNFYSDPLDIYLTLTMSSALSPETVPRSQCDQRYLGLKRKIRTLCREFLIKGRGRKRMQLKLTTNNNRYRIVFLPIRLGTPHRHCAYNVHLTQMSLEKRLLRTVESISLIVFKLIAFH